MCFQLWNISVYHKKSLKMSKGQWEATIHRRTNNSLEWSTKLYSKYWRLSSTSLTKTGWILVIGRIGSFCPTSNTRRVTVNRHDNHLIWKSRWALVHVRVYIYMYNMNKTWTSNETNGSKDKMDINFTRKSYWTSQHGTKHVTIIYIGWLLTFLTNIVIDASYLHMIR
jgi:hypothetical protein